MPFLCNNLLLDQFNLPRDNLILTLNWQKLLQGSHIKSVPKMLKLRGDTLNSGSVQIFLVKPSPRNTYCVCLVTTKRAPIRTTKCKGLCENKGICLAPE